LAQSQLHARDRGTVAPVEVPIAVSTAVSSSYSLLRGTGMDLLP
jgi:hypothetical protein